MIRLAFTVPGEPHGKARPRLGKGHVYTPKKTKSYEQLIAMTCRSHMGGTEPLDGAICLSVRAYLKTPLRLVGKEAERPLKTPDVDNILKVVQDALNGVAWHDDRQIVSACAEKYYSLEPRVEIHFWKE